LLVRILGLDVGSKRIGVSVSDELGLTAQGLETLICGNPDADVQRVANIARQYRAQEIVVGMPYNMNGTSGRQAEKVRRFVQRLESVVDVPIREWDERLSTVAAERVLLEADLSRGKRRKLMDKVAAVIILQGYLDRKRYEALSEQ
jgi:putative Holliday junction resolvase